MAKPVVRQNITSEWSPKIERAWAATVRRDVERRRRESPAILFMFGSSAAGLATP